MCAGYTIWVDGFDEHDASVDELQGFINLLTGLKGRPVYNMYVGYFSILITNKYIGLLNGVSHGMEYGESRAVYPVGGGLPVSKYYYMPLHRRIDFTKAFYLLSHLGISLDKLGDFNKYYKEICGCKQCKDVIKDNMSNFTSFESTEFYEIKRNNLTTRRKKASSGTKENCLYHFLLCKKQEFAWAHKHQIDDLVSKLIEEKEKYQSCSNINDRELDYIDNWVSILKKYIKKNG
jgi:hypothetical protein